MSEATYTCPHCGLVSSALRWDGKARRVCPDPACLGRAWHAAARAWLKRERARHPDRPARRGELPLRAVLEVRERYQSQGIGYRRLAQELGLPVSSVRRIVISETYRDVGED